MAKTDKESAFRIFPIHRDDWELLGMLWEDKYYVDLFLPFGLRYNKKQSHTQLDSRKQVIAFQDRVITINIKEAQHPLK